MTNLKKINEALGLVVTLAVAVVKLSELWKTVGPDVKKALQPVLDGCKKIAIKSDSLETKPVTIENSASN